MLPRAAGAMNPVVQTPIETIGQVEWGGRISAWEFRKDNPAHIGIALAFGVLEIKQVGRSDDKQASIITSQGGRPGQVVGINSAGRERAIAFGIFEHADAAQVGADFTAVRVISHFGDKEASVFIEGHGYGGGNQGRGGD